uniref:Zinc finger BED domain-containing protein 5 n=1 Tax=Chelonoidis abingdonii TaxID=106734 RepID=A0A8C0GFK3_CHEAB
GNEFQDIDQSTALPIYTADIQCEYLIILLKRICSYVNFCKTTQLEKKYSTTSTILSESMKLVGENVLCTDGAWAMIGKMKGAVMRIISVAPESTKSHCVLHRQALAVKKNTSISENYAR